MELLLDAITSGSNVPLALKSFVITPGDTNPVHRKAPVPSPVFAFEHDISWLS